MENQWPPEPNAAIRIEQFGGVQFKFENEILTYCIPTLTGPKLLGVICLAPIEFAIVKLFWEVHTMISSAPPQVTAAVLHNPKKVLAIGGLLMVTAAIFVLTLLAQAWLLRPALLMRLTMNRVAQTIQMDDRKIYPLSGIESIRVASERSLGMRLFRLDVNVVKNANEKPRRYYIGIFRERETAERCARQISEFAGLGFITV
ncbi:MAG: hypothetical protein JWQ02_3031 [Capsulimonas sp.]|nr:hypothetical protein [Capsulimonas sp.]